MESVECSTQRISLHPAQVSALSLPAMKPIAEPRWTQGQARRKPEDGTWNESTGPVQSIRDEFRHSGLFAFLWYRYVPR